MKRNAPGHPKTLALASMLCLKRYEAVGLLELLWHFTASYCPRGDIGKRTDAQIVAALDWPQDRAGELMGALVECGWLDRDPEHRLVVHDWHDHADGTCDKYLGDHGLQYATGHDPRRKSADSDKRSRDKSRLVATSRDYRAGARVPEPEPEPEPSPKPPSGACEREWAFWMMVVGVESGLAGRRGRLFAALTFDAFRDALRSCQGWTDEHARALVEELKGVEEPRIGNPKAYFSARLLKLVHPPADRGGGFQKIKEPAPAAMPVLIGEPS